MGGLSWRIYKEKVIDFFFHESRFQKLRKKGSKRGDREEGTK